MLMLGKYAAERVVSQVFRLLPIKENRVVCISHGRGGQYADSPRYITEQLLEREGRDYEIVWVFEDPDKFSHVQEKGIKTVKLHTLGELYYSNTAKVYITNLFGTFGYVIKRKNRMVLETSHGVPYKLLHYESLNDGKMNPFEKAYWKIRINSSSLCLSGSKLLSERGYRSNLGYKGEILEEGLPRNDVFYRDHAKAACEVKRNLGIDEECRVALVMPTWRKEQPAYMPDIDYRALVNALERKTSERWAVVLRLHHLSEAQADASAYAKHEEALFDATSYPSSQDLLLSADLLITDYSSVIWDFSLRELPILLFQPDLHEYESNRGFNAPPSEWGLFSAATTDGLIRLIEEYSYKELCDASRRHLEKYGCCETGHATETVCQVIDAYVHGSDIGR